MNKELGPKILTLRSEGRTYNEITQTLGCSKGVVSYHLGAGQKEKARKRASSGKYTVREFVLAQKDKPCFDCGIQYPYYVMQFDHRPGEIKAFGLAQVSRVAGSKGSLDKVAAEIAKCDIVCANCHAERTWRRAQHSQVA